MEIRTTPPQRDKVCRTARAKDRWGSERVWTYLVADILARSPSQGSYIQTLCGRDPVETGRCRDVWYEAQPLASRRGALGETETNTKLDLAIGDVYSRGKTAAGIAYAPAERSWVCFVEAKVLHDCSVDVTHDPLRNQLTRVIECLLCFQNAVGDLPSVPRTPCFPSTVYFTLLTPRLYRAHPTSRLYGYKFAEYKQDPRRILEDIEQCLIAKRNTPDWKYPNLDDRIEALRLSWVTYEEILEPELGISLDVARIARTGQPPTELEDRLREMLRTETTAP